MTGFPSNVVEELKTTFIQHLAGVDDDPKTEVITRPVRFTDPSLSLGIYALDWRPREDSAFIGQQEPSLNLYRFRIQSLVKHTSEEEARTLYTTHAKMVRVILYRDNALRVRLAELQETLLGSVERFQRFGIQSQGYLNNELRGNWVYLATTDLWVETETTQIQT